MKKKLSIILAALFVLVMGTSVFAADSPTTPSPTTPSPVAPSPESPVVDVEGAEGITVEEIALAADTKAAAAKYGVEESNVAVVLEINGTVTSTPAKVTVTVAGIKKGEALYGIHIKDDGTTEIVPVEAIADDTIVITASSFSPFIIVKGEAPKAAETPAPTDKEETTSPQMGQTLPYALLLAMGCLAGAAFCTKKLVADK